MLPRLLKKRRSVVVSVVVVVIAAGGVATWLATRPASAQPSFRLVPASVTTLRQTVSSSGTIEPAQRSDLNFGVSGQVTAVNVTVGQQVAAGQALATVQSASLQATVAQADSSLASARSKLSADQSTAASAAQIDADQAAITAAQNQLTNAQNALGEATITSPIAGTVAAVNLTVGQQVSAGGSSSSASSSSSGNGSNSQNPGGNPGTGNNNSSSSQSSSSTAEIVVISTDSYLVDASVDDTEISQIKNGEQAVITPNGSTTPVYGTVASVAVMASGSSSVPSYPISIDVTGNPPGLIAGAGATVSIIVKQLTDVLTVPTAAVHFTGGQPSVDVMNGNQRVSRPITTGMTSGGLTEVLNGLSEGDQVVIDIPAGAGNGGTGTNNGGRGGGPGGAGGNGGRGGGRGGLGGAGGGRGVIGGLGG
ncbi:efflux RND transporter periplasmic adaptor subunit [Amycolatopsis taiwanensis]|uniref:efflux RND transporter periplasmic adaptor subunit n=1 Tax=Amycolatopsis taiwanensis TaxID=342230 RepID=UPI00255570F1|nr:biotin/lipoyl-binding protein [Amycolatopsis taiwanensis]